MVEWKIKTDLQRVTGNLKLTHTLKKKKGKGSSFLFIYNQEGLLWLLTHVSVWCLFPREQSRLNYWGKNQLILKYAPANKREIALSVFAADLLFTWPN